MNRDRLYAAIGGDGAAPFRFDERVADVFPDMIRRSVPGYELVLQEIGTLARRFVKPGTAVYDLGCSLGAVTLVLRRSITHDGCRIIAVDASPAMVERCRQAVARDAGRVPVSVLEGDVTTLAFEAASLVVMNYTLQFVAPEGRAPLLARVHRQLVPGGALILSEKLRFPDPAQDARLAELHHDFKRANGYSELEISRKRAALEDVLRRDSWEEHRDRLEGCGFAVVERWFQCYNFVSMLAIRAP